MLARRLARLSISLTAIEGVPMPSPTDPADVDHPELRELALQADWVAQLEGAVGALEDLVLDFTEDEEPAPDDDAGEEEPLAVALSVVQSAYEDADRALEERVARWLAEDPEHWPIFRLVVLETWQQEPGQWRERVPRWVRALGTTTTIAHFQEDPFGRQRVVDI
jgi:hypothetical protein